MNQYGENFEYLRERMVREQLLGRDIKDIRVIDAFRRVPRHRFVDPNMYQDAYCDFPLSIGKGQTISQPYIVALMVQLLDLKSSNKVLEIGTGSGYETAILAELAGEIFSIERIEVLAHKAKRILEELGYKNIYIKTDDGTLGWQEFAPFDKIVVTASAEEIPEPLLGQLKEEGRLVMPVGPRFSQILMLLEKTRKGDVVGKDICGCTFVPLIGKYGWRDDAARKDI
jgi:protein-L-isoaspartate(D-aspartate) O-methyltransferase